MSRQKRKEPTDIVKNAASLLIGKVHSFQERYPTITKLRVEITEGEIGIAGSLRRWILTESCCYLSVKCSNPRCLGGAVDIDWIIGRMAENRETDREETKICRGHECTSKWRKSFRRCTHAFVIKTHVEYKEK